MLQKHQSSVIISSAKWSAERFMSIYKAIHKCQYLHNILSFKISRLKAIQQHMMWWKEIWRHQMTKRYNKIQYGTKHGEQSAKTSHLVPSSCVAWHDGHKNHQVAERTYILVKHRAETATTIITTFMHVKLLTYKLSYAQFHAGHFLPKASGSIKHCHLSQCLWLKRARMTKYIQNTVRKT